MKQLSVQASPKIRLSLQAFDAGRIGVLKGVCETGISIKGIVKVAQIACTKFIRSKFAPGVSCCTKSGASCQLDVVGVT